MGDAELTAAEITVWFEARNVKYRLAGGLPIADLVQLYMEEGKAEHVRPELAFAQSIIETGSFGNALDNNYAGIGACDSCNGEPAFPTPRDGVRGQIQLLRNYADPTSRAANLANPPSPTIYGNDLASAVTAVRHLLRQGPHPDVERDGQRELGDRSRVLAEGAHGVLPDGELRREAQLTAVASLGNVGVGSGVPARRPRTRHRRRTDRRGHPRAAVDGVRDASAGCRPSSACTRRWSPCCVYAVFGRSRQLSVGPLATISIIGAVALSRLAPTGSAQYVSYAATLALLVGGVHLVLGLGRLGFLMRFLSEPLMAGLHLRGRDHHHHDPARAAVRDRRAPGEPRLSHRVRMGEPHRPARLGNPRDRRRHHRDPGVRPAAATGPDRAGAGDRRFAGRAHVRARRRRHRGGREGAGRARRPRVPSPRLARGAAAPARGVGDHVRRLPGVDHARGSTRGSTTTTSPPIASWSRSE